MFKRHYKKHPTRKALKAHMDFLNLGNQEDFISQCNDCIHSRIDPGLRWCDLFAKSPTGICMQRRKIQIKGTVK